MAARKMRKKSQVVYPTPGNDWEYGTIDYVSGNEGWKKAVSTSDGDVYLFVYPEDFGEWGWSAEYKDGPELYYNWGLSSADDAKDDADEYVRDFFGVTATRKRAFEDEIEVVVTGEYCDGYVYVEDDHDGWLSCDLQLDCWGDNGEDFVDYNFSVRAENGNDAAIEIAQNAEAEYGGDLAIDESYLAEQIDFYFKSAKRASRIQRKTAGIDLEWIDDGLDDYYDHWWFAYYNEYDISVCERDGSDGAWDAFQWQILDGELNEIVGQGGESTLEGAQEAAESELAEFVVEGARKRRAGLRTRRRRSAGRKRAFIDEFDVAGTPYTLKIEGMSVVVLKDGREVGIVGNAGSLSEYKLVGAISKQIDMPRDDFEREMMQDALFDAALDVIDYFQSGDIFSYASRKKRADVDIAPGDPWTPDPYMPDLLLRNYGDDFWGSIIEDYDGWHWELKDWQMNAITNSGVRDSKSDAMSACDGAARVISQYASRKRAMNKKARRIAKCSMRKKADFDDGVWWDKWIVLREGYTQKMQTVELKVKIDPFSLKASPCIFLDGRQWHSQGDSGFEFDEIFNSLTSFGEEETIKRFSMRKKAQEYADTFEYGFYTVDDEFMGGEVHIEDSEYGVWLVEIYGINGDSFEGNGTGDTPSEAAREALQDTGLDLAPNEESDFIDHLEFSMKEQGGSFASRKTADYVDMAQFSLNGDTAYEGTLCDGEYWFEVYPVDDGNWETRVVHEEEPRDDEFAFGYGMTPELSLQDAVNEMKDMGVQVTASRKRRRSTR